LFRRLHFKEDEMGHVERMKEIRNSYNIFIRKPEGKRQRGRPRRRWEDNIRMDIRETVWEGVDWMHLAQCKGCWWGHVITVKNLQVPQKAGDFLTS
jgi:hypothetical protein